MAKKIWFGILVLMLIFSMAVVGCDDGSSNGNVIEGIDSIVIKTVVPSTNLIDGVQQQFTVNFDWSLSTQLNGIITIVFNNELNINHYQQYGTIYVKQGSGSYTFSVAVTPKNWFSEGDFKVYVTLKSPTKSQSLAFDSKILSF